MTYYIITNRQVLTDKTGKETIDTSNNGVTTNNIRFAMFDSSSTDDNAYRLLPATPTVHEQFFAQLHNDMTGPDGGDVLVFIHGFYCGWNDNIDNLRSMEAQHINNPGSKIKHMVGISWPSRDSLTRYPADDKIAETSGEAVGKCFNLLVDFFAKMFPPENATKRPCNRKIHLMCHSMGNYVMQNMYATIVAAGNHYYSVFEEILLVAADVDNDCFEEDETLSLYALNNLCRRVHVYTNRSDRALTASTLLKHHKKRLGSDGPVDLNKVPNHVYIADATDVCTENDKTLEDITIHHWYYKNVPKVIADIDAVLHGANAESIPGRATVIPGVKFRIKQ